MLLIISSGGLTINGRVCSGLQQTALCLRNRRVDFICTTSRLPNGLSSRTATWDQTRHIIKCVLLSHWGRKCKKIDIGVSARKLLDPASDICREANLDNFCLLRGHPLRKPNMVKKIFTVSHHVLRRSWSPKLTTGRTSCQVAGWRCCFLETPRLLLPNFANSLETVAHQCLHHTIPEVGWSEYLLEGCWGLSYGKVGFLSSYKIYQPETKVKGQSAEGHVPWGSTSRSSEIALFGLLSNPCSWTSGYRFDRSWCASSYQGFSAR